MRMAPWARMVSKRASAAASPLMASCSSWTLGVATTGRRGVYPGTFNPPTVAHLAVADAYLYEYLASGRVHSLEQGAAALSDARSRLERGRNGDRCGHLR